jgi:hypothetical protein
VPAACCACDAVRVGACLRSEERGTGPPIEVTSILVARESHPHLALAYGRTPCRPGPSRPPVQVRIAVASSSSISCIAQLRYSLPPLAPTVATDPLHPFSPAPTSPELELQRPPPGAADCRHWKPPRPFLGPKSSICELLRLFPNFPGRNPRWSRRIPASRRPHQSQGPNCEV